MNDEDDTNDLFDFYGYPKKKDNIIPEVLKKEWKEQGRCDKCGFLGYWSSFKYVCPTHGEY